MFLIVFSFFLLGVLVSPKITLVVLGHDDGFKNPEIIEMISFCFSRKQSEIPNRLSKHNMIPKRIYDTKKNRIIPQGFQTDYLNIFSTNMTPT